ncbi:hypothetical protein B0H13DRAFT_1893260 [Mycena leptocephala]|nr:hypothetical protein B0H13DRAFT_1893260 [Mycena leptocephala]
MTPLLTLPTELLLELASPYPFPFTNLSPCMRPQDWAEERLERRQFLRPLSQTCSTLRAVFLPLLWRHFEACNAHLHIKYKRAGISEQTGIFTHMRFVHISLTPPSPYVLARLFDFLQNLPNLECLQLYSVDYSLLQSLAGAFNDYPLATVTTLCIPGGTTLFPAFPNVQSLTFSTYAHHDTLRLARRSFPQLHSLGGVHLNPDAIVELHGFPHLRSLYLSGPIHETSAPLLSRLSALPFLSSLSLENQVISRTTAKLLPLEALIAAGTNVLRVARGRGQKVLTVWIFNKGQTEVERDPVVIYVG